MSKERLYDAITNISEAIIEEAQEAKPPKRTIVWKRWIAVAACFCIALTGMFYARSYIGGMAGGGSSGDSLTYMSYAGPVFPLTTSEETSCLTAERRINFDFSPYSSAIVTDGYLLENNSDSEKTITAIYPFAASFQDKADVCPKITVNGEEMETKLNAGPYSGSFEGAWGSKEEGSLNLARLNNWESYQALIERGYMERAFDEWPRLNQTVVVYEISERYADEADFEDNAPTLNMEFTMDSNRTTVLTYNMNGAVNDMENARYARSTSIPQSFNPDYGQSAYMIVLGDDIGEYKLQGYKDGGCDKGEELDSVTGNITRYETTFETIFSMLAEQYRELYDSYRGTQEERYLINELTFPTFVGAAAELLYDYGPLSEAAMQRYDFGALEDMFSETLSMDRILYLTFEVTIPAGSSAELTASMEKNASIDFIGKKKERNGYDMVTQLGSNLKFISENASISNTEDIEIINQNFGFDLKRGITMVELEIANEHYYMNVRKLK